LGWRQVIIKTFSERHHKKWNSKNVRFKFLHRWILKSGGKDNATAKMLSKVSTEYPMGKKEWRIEKDVCHQGEDA